MLTFLGIETEREGKKKEKVNVLSAYLHKMMKIEEKKFMVLLKSHCKKFIAISYQIKQNLSACVNLHN